MLDKDKIKEIFIDTYISEETIPDIEKAILGILEGEIGDMVDELESAWSDEREQYLSDCKEWDDHVRQHSGPL